MAAAVRDPIIVPGRESQLDRLVELVEAQPFSLTVVAGPVGVGKTTFLRALEERLRGGVWSAGNERQDVMLEVAADAEPGRFVEKLREWLGIPQHEGIVDSSADLDPSDTGAEVDGKSSAPRPEETGIDLLGRQLQRRPGKVLVLIDGYRPAREFHDWFTATLLTRLPGQRRHLAIVVADDQEGVARLRPQATHWLDLDGLDRDALQRHFGSLLEHADPKPADDEVATYVDATLKEPRLFDPLSRLLSLTNRPSGVTS